MANVVLPAVNSIPQGEPREGRLSLELGENGKAGLAFTTGAEIFQWNSGALQSGQRLTAILSAWVDNTAMPIAASSDPPNFLVLQIGRQTFRIPAGVQTYILCAPYLPTTVTVSASTFGGPYGVQVILYNYNVSFTGANFAGSSQPLVGQVQQPPSVSAGDGSSLDSGALGYLEGNNGASGNRPTVGYIRGIT